MKKHIAALLLIASPALAQDANYTYPTGYNGCVKLKRCYNVVSRKEVWNNPYLDGEQGFPPRYGATAQVLCNGDKEMLVNYGIKTPYLHDREAPGSFGVILEQSLIDGPESFPKGVKVDSIPSSLGKPYTLIVRGLCCRYR